MLQKIVQAGVRNRSYLEGSRELQESAELLINEKAIERVVRRIGQERTAQRDAAATAWQQLPLPEQWGTGLQAKAPPVAVVQFDCGRMLVRERIVETLVAEQPSGPRTEETPNDQELAESAAISAINLAAAEASAAKAETEDQPAPEDAVCAAAQPDCNSRHWRDSKVGCLLSMYSVEQTIDPCPQVPGSFVDPRYITQLVREFGGSVPAAPEASNAPGETHEKGDRPGKPTPLVRSIVSSRLCSAAFGPILAAAAWARGFAAAQRKAFVADGAAMNWTLWQRHFSHYTPILDFIHALQYVFAAAMAGQPFAVGWSIYCRWIQQVWSGEVAEMIAELQQRHEQLGHPPSNAVASDPRQVVATTLGYLQSHQTRMHYARYRCAGLPIMSSYVESTVKQINHRVKGTEKFWCNAGAEAILQLRADYLSDTQPLQHHWQQRQQQATGHRSYRRAK